MRRTRLTDHKSGLYRTPVEAVHSLLAIEKLPAHLWEPACGDGAIVLPLRELGYVVEATDLVDHGCPGALARVDFLMERERLGAQGIVSNPPYKLAREFCEHSIGLVPYVAMLLPLAFLAGQERRLWFLTFPPQRVHVSSRRLPMMHRAGWEGPIATSTVDHAWFVWDSRPMYPAEKGTIVKWFDWKARGAP